MSYIIVGLGNPGEDYKNTRHNAGRIIAQIFAEKNGSNDFQFDRKLKAEKAKVVVGKKIAMVLLPDTFMNKSGGSIKPLITSVKKAKELIVAHDDLDIPFGKFKLSFGKNSGGNKGVESIIRAIKTKNFIRVRIGIAPVNASGKIKKIKGVEKVGKLILGNFTPNEMRKLKYSSEKIAKILETIITDGYEKAISIGV